MVDEQGMTRVVSELFGIHMDDSTFHAGRPVGLPPFWRVTDLDHYEKRPETKPCPPDAYFALVSAELRNRHKWTADGTPWPR